MTHSLLELSRLESDESEEEIETVNASDLLRYESESYASRAEQKEIIFTLDLPVRDIEILGRPGQIRRVVRNLLDNAIKFTPEGGSVQAGLVSEGEHIEIYVQDTGIGISEGEISNLFQRFYRARNASAYPGSGLGLAIVKSIVEAHGGVVRANSLDEGVRFSVYLPLRSDEISH